MGIYLSVTARENTALAALKNRLTVTAAPGVWNKPKGMV